MKPAKQHQQDQSQHAQVGLSITRQVLMITVQVELYDDVLENLKHRALNILQKHGLKAVLLDLSHVQLLDREMAKQLENTLAMAQLLGAQSVVVGIQPNVAACMIHWDNAWQGIRTARSLDDGLSILTDA
jgi:rsbT antagonist protein RsbS